MKLKMFTIMFIIVFFLANMVLSQSHPVAIAIGVLLVILFAGVFVVFVVRIAQSQEEIVYGPIPLVTRSSTAQGSTYQTQSERRHSTIHSIRRVPSKPSAGRQIALNAGDIMDDAGVRNFLAGIDLAAISQGVIIDTPWIDYILTGKKTWEMRSSVCKKIGPIALIKKGSKKIYGVAYISDSDGPHNNLELARTTSFHQIPEEIYTANEFKWRYAWKLTSVYKLQTPISYVHRGGVIWVNLDNEALEQLRDAKLTPVHQDQAGANA